VAAAWLGLEFERRVNRRSLMIAMPPMTKTAATAAIVPPMIFFVRLKWGILIRVNVHIEIEFMDDNSRG
jgi:hypothetical protein